MRLVSYIKNKQETLGLFHDNKIIPIYENAKTVGVRVPDKMSAFLKNWTDNYPSARMIDGEFRRGNLKFSENKNSIEMLAPVPYPSSCRDAYAFRQHVVTARQNRGLDIIPEYDQFPVFYFTNHNAIMGSGDIVLEEDHFNMLDFELEAAIVIGKGGKNITSDEADSHIAGFMIMNDFSARQFQMEEMKLNLGPAKGKDFATAVGPYLVTKDELEKHKVYTKEGYKYNLKMTAHHNGKLISEGNLADMDWTFAQIIERASYGVDLHPGDIIGSGTVGTGCFLELNGTASKKSKKNGKKFEPTWLQPGDEIKLTIEELGELSNRVLLSENNYSILEKKKNV